MYEILIFNELSFNLAQITALEIVSYAFKPSLLQDMREADLIICHCGAGTILEVLSLQKKAVGVINPILMDNHQKELADAMSERNMMIISSDPSDLIDSLTKANWDQLVSSNTKESTVLLDEISTMISL